MSDSGQEHVNTFNRCVPDDLPSSELAADEEQIERWKEHMIMKQENMFGDPCVGYKGLSIGSTAVFERELPALLPSNDSKYSGLRAKYNELRDRRNAYNKATREVCILLWGCSQAAEVSLLLRGIFPVSPTMVLKAGWKILLSSCWRAQLVTKAFSAISSSEFCPVVLASGFLANPEREDDELRQHLNMILQFPLIERLEALVRRLRHHFMHAVDNAQAFKALRRDDFGLSWVKLLKDLQDAGAGNHEPQYDFYSGRSCEYFGSNIVKHSVAIMLQSYDRVDIEEAMSLYNDQLLPITCLVIPSIMMESELQFQLGQHGNGYRFVPKGAENGLLSGEHEAFAARINQLCDVRMNAMSDTLYFSIQVRVLFPLRVEVLGAFQHKIPLLSFVKPMLCLPELEGSSEGQSNLGSEAGSSVGAEGGSIVAVECGSSMGGEGGSSVGGSSVGGSSLGSEPNAPFVESDSSDSSGPFVEEQSSPIDSSGGASRF